MKVSASIEFVWQLARQEAIAAKFKEITPNHFLAAMLKFSELPVKEVENIASGQNVAKELAADVNAVRKALKARSIDTTKTRNLLRASLGRGNNKYDGELMHRSLAARALFDFAASLADDANSETLTPLHLLEAMLVSPTEAMTDVLGDSAGPCPQGPSRTPMLNEFGRNLVHMAAEGDLKPGKEQMVEGKALLRALSLPDRKSVLLITGDESVAMRTVIRAAQAVAAKDCPADLKGKWIVDVSTVKPRDKTDTMTTGQLDKLLVEAAVAERVILFVPAIQEIPKDKQWADFLKTVLAQRSLQCICQVTPVAYRKSFAKDRMWRRLIHVMWVQKKNNDEVPLEL